MINIRKQAACFGAILLFFQAAPLSLTQAYAETDDAVDPQLVEAFRLHQSEYLNLNQPIIPVETETEAVQEFSFMDKTFRTTVGQPVLLRFTSTLPANEVLVRIPANGQIVEEAFYDGESIQHAHGEYWTLKTNSQQTEFILPVVFEETGQYFFTVDHDADHFYLEVEENRAETSTVEPKGHEESDLTEQSEMNTEEQQKKSQESDSINDSPTVVHPVMATEKNLSISEELISAEDTRILEETLDPSTRSISNVSNWSQFRSAWNSSGTSEIRITATITYSSSILGSSLNARSSSVLVSSNGNIVGSALSFGMSTNNLQMTGTAVLRIRELQLRGGNSQQAIIQHDGSGLVEVNTIISSFSGNRTVIAAQNINLNGSFQIATPSNYSAILVVRSGTLTINPDSSAVSYISSAYGTTNSRLKPISTDATSRIIINTNRLTMGTGVSTPRSSWDQVNATLTGVNGSQVVSSTSEPDDFAERYTQLFNEAWYSSLIFNGRGSGFEPPVQTGTVTAKYLDDQGNELAESESFTGNVGTTYTTSPKDIEGWTLTEMPSNATGLFTLEPITVEYRYERTKRRLTLQASPAEGGSPSADEDTLIAQEETEIHANPNDGYRFVSWEILSGTGIRIADETAETTTFTMGSSDVVLQANYEEEATDVRPVDPLEPDKEVDPENPPQLPEDQGRFSIDFVSQFDFGVQAISAQDQTYYAKPQRLLAEDGTVLEGEERPNYVQVSDRRSTQERDGWELSVRQNDPFTNRETGEELTGARLILQNQQIATAQGGTAPGLAHTNPMALNPGGAKRTLLKAQGPEGEGTWIYRFGDADSADKSVALEVPRGATPSATSYQTTLTWELSSVPDN